ncbi:MAG: hypothetical protein CR997_07015 [Acidobacteria bacterium]|nr:MAG: hypothetical protein CR997_07015 [Acidobacteriota bacterium]
MKWFTIMTNRPVFDAGCNNTIKRHHSSHVTMCKIYLVNPHLSHAEDKNLFSNRASSVDNQSTSSLQEDTVEFLYNLIGDNTKFHIVSSPHRNCLQMAGILSERNHTVVKISNAFSGMDLGEWKGKKEESIRKVDQNRLDHWTEDANFPSPGGESLSDVSRRCWPELVSTVQQLHSDEHLVLFAPFEIIAVLTCSLLHAPLTALHKMTLSEGGLVIYKKNPSGNYQLYSWNLQKGGMEITTAETREMSESATV